MSPTLAMIHTIRSPVIERLCQELMPDVDRFHILDEGLLRMVLRAGGPTPEICQRLSDNAACAQEAGASVILVTCSTLSPCVAAAQQMVSVPLLTIDEPMADKAVASGTRIGIAATARVTLKPTADLIEVRSKAAGKHTQIELCLCEGAYEPMLAGDMARHDQIVTEYLHQLMQVTDVIVLAQASMAHIPDGMPEAERRVPILTSPRLGLERARDLLIQSGA